MAKITVKQLAKLEESLKQAIRVWALLDTKASKSLGKKTRNGLAIAEAAEAFDSVRETGIRYLGALVLGEDASNWGGTNSSVERWLKQLRSNGTAFAAAFELVIAAPYAAVFANAERNAKRAK